MVSVCAVFIVALSETCAYNITHSPYYLMLLTFFGVMWCGVVLFYVCMNVMCLPCRLHVLVSEFMQQYDSDAVIITQLQQCFHNLFSARNVSVTESTKPNERNFILNMRECLIELQLVIRDA